MKYCETDVVALEQLFYRMLPQLDLPHALFRGAYMPAVASMEYAGVPVNAGRVQQLRENWTPLRKHLAAKVGAEFGGIYDENLKFSYAPFADWVRRDFKHWPLTEKGPLLPRQGYAETPCQGRPHHCDLSRTAFRHQQHEDLRPRSGGRWTQSQRTPSVGHQDEPQRTVKHAICFR